MSHEDATSREGENGGAKSKIQHGERLDENAPQFCVSRLQRLRSAITSLHPVAGVTRNLPPEAAQHGFFARVDAQFLVQPADAGADSVVKFGRGCASRQRSALSSVGESIPSSAAGMDSTPDFHNPEQLNLQTCRQTGRLEQPKLQPPILFNLRLAPQLRRSEISNQGYTRR